MNLNLRLDYKPYKSLQGSPVHSLHNLFKTSLTRITSVNLYTLQIQNKKVIIKTNQLIFSLLILSYGARFCPNIYTWIINKTQICQVKQQKIVAGFWSTNNGSKSNFLKIFAVVVQHLICYKVAGLWTLVNNFKLTLN